MACVASQLIEEVTAHVQRDSLEDAREIWPDDTYFLNNLRIYLLRQTFYSLVANILTIFGEKSIEFSSLLYRIDFTET